MYCQTLERHERIHSTVLSGIDGLHDTSGPKRKSCGQPTPPEFGIFARRPASAPVSAEVPATVYNLEVRIQDGASGVSISRCGRLQC